LVQIPEGFGTGCIVQTVDRPELFEPTTRLLRGIGFTGIAEVEYKWDAENKQYQLIEINPRPWDQHRLGNACGVDLIHLAYSAHAGLPRPVARRQAPGHKWIAEDAFFLAALRLLWNRDAKFGSLFRLARGCRIYAIWSLRDPLPFVAYMVTDFIPGLAGIGIRAVWTAIKAGMFRKAYPPKKGFRNEPQLENEKSHV
jgi:predicted ATP-grasp superfamily ATP-dependent carboligase